MGATQRRVLARLIGDDVMAKIERVRGAGGGWRHVQRGLRDGRGRSRLARGASGYTGLMLLLASLACTDVTLERQDPTDTAADCDPTLAMDAPTALERTPAELVSALEWIFLTLYWGAEGPLTGSDPVAFYTTWSSAWGTCTDDPGVFVQGEAELSSTSGLVDSAGPLTLFFPEAHAWEFAPQVEDALPVDPTSALEAAAHDSLGAGELLWLSLTLSKTDYVALDGSVDNGDAITTGHVQEGVFTVSDPC